MLAAPLVAVALPAEKGALPECSVERVDGATRTLPDRGRATLVIYEDKDAGPQNKHVKWLFDRADGKQNHAALAVIPVADVAAYDFWPAKRFVLADIRKREAKDRTTIWLDWKGRVRERWGLTRGRSGVVLVDAAGKVRFAAEGPLDQAQVDRLYARLVEIGCDVK